MWSIDAPYEVSPQNFAIEPAHVLYKYEGPTIFTARLGFTDSLFLKVDEFLNSDLFLVVKTNAKMIEMLQHGKLSVRGAMASDSYWIIEADRYLVPLRYWECTAAELPEDFLPDRGFALFAHLGKAPDTMEQAEGFFTVAYRGKNMSSEGMPFSTFKNLVINTYDTSRRILSPILLLGTKTSTFDFTIAEPKFGSLIITIDAPILNSEWVRQHADGDDALMEGLQEQISQQRVNFFDQLNPVIEEARKGEVLRDYDANDRSIIEQLRYVLPHEEGNITDIEFSANFGNKTSTIHVTNEVGGRIHRAFDRSEEKPIYVAGAVTEINAERRTFRIKNALQRQITCLLPQEWFDEIHANPLFTTGAKVGLTGFLERRTRIDLLRLEEQVRLI
ncbi:hypothetical protein [Methylobacterium sp. CM6247]